MDFFAYNNILICKDPVVQVEANGQAIGYEFRIKYPSYRGAYLSCIEGLSFEVDGRAVPQHEVFFQLNGKQFLLDELKDQYKEYWFIRDKATVRVLRDGGLPAGPHDVRVIMRHRVPYTGYFGQYLVLDSDETATLQA